METILPSEIMENLHKFREKIKELKQAEEDKLKRGESSSAHFQNVNADELLAEDMQIYQRYLDGKLTKEEFKSYIKQFDDSHIDIRDSRYSFAAYIGNKLTVRFLREEIENRNKSES